MENKNLFSESGIIITLILILIPVLIAAMLVVFKAFKLFKTYFKKKELEKFNTYLRELNPEEIKNLEQRKTALEFALKNNELAGNILPEDPKGLINNVAEADSFRFIEQKKKGQARPYVEPALTNLIFFVVYRLCNFLVVIWYHNGRISRN